MLECASYGTKEALVKRYISTEEAAAIMGVTERWVRQLAKQGEIKARRWGRDWQISRVAAEAFERQRKAKTPVNP
jgi:excisionase family DNA binding protein